MASVNAFPSSWSWRSAPPVLAKVPLLYRSCFVARRLLRALPPGVFGPQDMAPFRLRASAWASVIWVTVNSL